MAQVQINKRGNATFELVPGMELPEIPEMKVDKKPKNCPVCGGSDLNGTEDYYSCPKCGMGHYYDGRRLH